MVHARLRESLRSALGELGDLERLAVRASLGEASPRDLGGLRDGLAAAASAVLVLSDVRDAELREVLGITADAIDTVPELARELALALVERPSALSKQGEIFRAEFDKELGELDALRRHGTERMVELEGRLRETTGITTLRVRFTRVFGWYIEVSRGKSGSVPAEFRRKQTVASGERYTTPEVDELADKLSHAEERHRERELALLSELVKRAGQAAPRIAALSERLAGWDVAAGLADVAHRHDYVRPKVDDSEVLSLRDARHPVVERLSARGKNSVPNDVELDIAGERLWLVSQGRIWPARARCCAKWRCARSWRRWAASCRARAARIGVVDRVLSRVGASDNLAGGESTFMVEMRETAEILRSATRRSLVILDEIGRGTCTFDGLSIAWAVAEYLDEVVGCRALFATHYHELVSLAEQSEHVGSYSVSAREQNDDVVFLHRLVPGAANRSYGVAVAKLAGLPEPVLARARGLLASMERKDEGGTERRAKAGKTPQLSLFGERSAESRSQVELVETLRALDLDRLTGLEALSLLQRLKAKL